MPASVIMVSGWATDGRCWQQVLERLGARFDVRSCPWWECLEDGDTLCRAIGEAPGDCVLVGWSLGAMVALEAAARMPDLLGVVAVSGTPRLVADQGWPGVQPRVLRAMEIGVRSRRAQVLEEFAGLCVRQEGQEPGGVPDESAFVPHFLAMAEGVSTERLTGGLRHFRETDLRAIVPRIAARTIVLHGEGDAVVPPDAARALAGLVPRCRLKVIAEGTHALPYTHPGPILRAIEELTVDCSSAS